MASINMSLGCVLQLVAGCLLLGNIVEAKFYNQTCHNSQDCGRYTNMQCDTETGRCLCPSWDVYDPGELRCRYSYCFETCLAPGYECKWGQCQQCWTQDNRYICDRPEEVYIPVAIAVGCTFFGLVSLWLLVNVCGFLRRINRAFFEYLDSHSQSKSQPQDSDRLMQSQYEVDRSDPQRPRIADPVDQISSASPVAADIGAGANRSGNSSEC